MMERGEEGARTPPTVVGRPRAPGRVGWPGRIAIMLLAVAAFAGSLTGPYLLDDLDEIATNPRVHTLASIPSLLTTDFWFGERGRGLLYRPVLAASIPPLFAAGGGSPVPFHAANLLFHALAAALAASITGRISGSGRIGLVTGLVFAVHPIHAEAVAWISGRSDLMFAATGLAAWWVHLRAFETRSRWRIAGACLLLALSLGSKETAVVWLPLLVVGDLVAGWIKAPTERAGERAHVSRGHGRAPDAVSAGIAESGWRRFRAGAYAAYSAVLIAGLGARVAVLGSLAGRVVERIPLLNPLADRHDWIDRAPTSVRLLGLAAGKTLLPGSTCIDYGFDQISIAGSWWEPDVMVGLGIALAAAAALLLRILRGRATPPAAALALAPALFMLPWLPTSSLLTPSVALFAERNLYLPALGAALAAGALLDIVASGGRSRRALAASALVVVVVIAALVSNGWSGAFRDSLLLTARSAATCSRSARGHHFHAAELAGRGRLTEAVEAYGRALAIAPGYSSARTDLARVLARLGRTEEARREARRAAESALGAVESRLGAAAALAAAGLREESDRLFEEIRAAAPDDPSVVWVSGERSLAAGRLDEAAAAFTRLRQLLPAGTAGALGIAEVAAARGDAGGSRRAYAEALVIDPYEPLALVGLGGLLARDPASGPEDLLEAERLLSRAVRLGPRDATAWIRLALVHERRGDPAAAERGLRRALDLAPTHPGVRSALAAFLRRQGRTAEAEALEPGRSAPELPDPDSRGR